MYIDFKDITDRAGRPKWWLYGVPRYCKFTPRAATVYGREVVLVDTTCQSCGYRFLVALTSEERDEIANRIISLRRVFARDPPNIGCCPSGPSMTSNELAVLEYWRKNDELEWERHSTLEIDLADKEHA